MKALVVALVCVLGAGCAAPESSTTVREVALDEYAGTLEAATLAVYAVARYAVVEANGAEAAALRDLAPGLQRLTAEFDARLAALRRIKPVHTVLEGNHRAFLGRFTELETWSKDLLTAFAGGASGAVIEVMSRGRPLLVELGLAHEAFAAVLSD